MKTDVNDSNIDSRGQKEEETILVPKVSDYTHVHVHKIGHEFQEAQKNLEGETALVNFQYS